MDQLTHLTEELRKLCHKNGREKNPASSAKTLHKMGLVYLYRAPDKFSLLRSAVLLVAARLRKPDNLAEVENDLRRLCFLVIDISGAKNNADLVDASFMFYQELESYRRKVLTQLSAMRLNTTDLKCQNDTFSETDNRKSFESDIQWIDETEAFQRNITSTYLKIMNQISDYCIKSVMGDPPCRFAHMALGSLSRNEATPYSDLESVIVLEEGIQLRNDYEDVLEYFRWYSVVFMLILIGFGETIIPFAAIPCLNDVNGKCWFYDSVAKCGVSPDGFGPGASINPLGREAIADFEKVELIKPVSEMTKLLHFNDSTRKNRYLADILTRTEFMSGDLKIYDEYVSSKAKVLRTFLRQQTEFEENQRKKIELCLRTFNTINDLANFEEVNFFDIKRAMYRTITMFLMHLGQWHDTKSFCSFEVALELKSKGVITNFTCHRLRVAIATACQSRLHIYMQNGGQDDFIHDRPRDSKYFRKQILDAVGFEHAVDYLRTAAIFQRLVGIPGCSDLLLFDALYSRFFRITTPKILLFFKLYDKAIACVKRYLDQSETGEDSILIKVKIVANENSVLREIPYSTYAEIFIGTCMFLKGKYWNAIERFKQASSVLHQEKKQVAIDSFLAQCEDNLGYCYLAVQCPEKSLNYHENALELKQNVSEKTVWFSRYYSDYTLATCFLRMKEYKQAKQWFHKALTLRRETSQNVIRDRHAAMCHAGLGACLTHMNEDVLALQNLKCELEIWERLTINDNCDIRIAECLHNIGFCCFRQKRYNAALEHYQKELEIWRNLPRFAPNSLKCFKAIRDCFFLLNQPARSVAVAEEHFQLLSQSRSNASAILLITEACAHIAESYFMLKRYHDALSWLAKEMKVREVVKTHGLQEQESCQKNISACWFALGDFHKASQNYEKLLNIQFGCRTPLKRIAKTLYCLGLCHSKTGHLELSLLFFTKELRLRLHALPYDEGFIALSLEAIGGCYFHLKYVDRAIECYRKEESVLQSQSQDNRDWNRLAKCSYQIGFCLENHGNIQGAHVCFQRQLHYFKRACEDASSVFMSQRNLAYAFSDLGRSLVKLNQFEGALENFVAEAEILEKLSQSRNLNRARAKCMNDVAKCLSMLKMHEEARDWVENANHLLCC